LPHRDGVQIDHAIDAVILLLQRHELDDRAEIIAEVQIAGGLHPGKDQLLECHCGTPCCAGHMPRRARAAQGDGRACLLRRRVVDCLQRPPRYSARALAPGPVFSVRWIASWLRLVSTFSASATRSST